MSVCHSWLGITVFPYAHFYTTEQLPTNPLAADGNDYHGATCSAANCSVMKQHSGTSHLLDNILQNGMDIASHPTYRDFLSARERYPSLSRHIDRSGFGSVRAARIGQGVPGITLACGSFLMEPDPPFRRPRRILSGQAWPSHLSL